MDPKQKKIEKFLKILSYREIRKEKVFDIQKRTEMKAKTGAKPASPARLAAKRAGGLLKLTQQEKTAQYSNTTNNWNIGRVFKRSLLTKNVFKKALALITIIAVIITTYLQFTLQTQAATN